MSNGNSRSKACTGRASTIIHYGLLGMSVELYLVGVLSPQLFASLMPITHPQFTPHPEHLKHLEDLEDLEQLEQLEQLEHLKHFEDLKDIPSDNSLTPHPLLQATYTGVRITVLGNIFFPSFLPGRGSKTPSKIFSLASNHQFTHVDFDL